MLRNNMCSSVMNIPRTEKAGEVDADTRFNRFKFAACHCLKTGGEINQIPASRSKIVFVFQCDGMRERTRAATGINHWRAGGGPAPCVSNARRAHAYRSAS